jgi:hypothetical protein
VAIWAGWLRLGGRGRDQGKDRIRRCVDFRSFGTTWRITAGSVRIGHAIQRGRDLGVCQGICPGNTGIRGRALKVIVCC